MEMMLLNPRQVNGIRNTKTILIDVLVSNSSRNIFLCHLDTGESLTILFCMLSLSVCSTV